ncbi:MAG: Dabb family protein [Methylococcales bacterium]|nr:Dabb family protein [Methylococcales bacterium]
MKQLILAIQLIALSSLLFISPVQAEEKDKVTTHVITVWLKDAGDETARKKFIEESKKLNNLPGIIHRHVAAVEKSDRSIVDDTFDVLITVTFKNKAAVQAYLDHPKHKAAVKVFKTMVNRIVIHNSIDY